MVDTGRRVGHRDHGGEPALRRRSSAGFDRVDVTVARLTQVRLEGDQSGNDDAAERIDHIGIRTGIDRVGDLDDVAVSQP